jgi:hypothetical protein
LGRWLVAAVFLLGFALFFRQQLLPGLERYWKDDLGPRLRGEPPATVTEPPPGGMVRFEVPQLFPEDDISALQFAPEQTLQVTVSIADFRPGGFVVPAVSFPIALSESPATRIAVAPAAVSADARYGMLPVGAGGVGIMLDRDEAGYRLLVDRNGDGDWQNDGPAVSAEGGGRFAASLRLPLAAIAGLGSPDEHYELWIYAPEDGHPPRALRVYCRTQLRGRVTLGSERFVAWLADNQVLDGDFSNDGIAIDLDGDGRIAPTAEWVRAGAALTRGDRAYRFRVER